jgi:phosphopantothenoylcysteine decarboxylase/phosphopantothenate--cysteine ligase
LVEPDAILGWIGRVLGRQGALAGRHVVVSAGPTREFLDPVRFLSNPSSGRQGFALAQAALDRGASVTLVAGPVHLSTPVDAERVDVLTTEEMKDAVLMASASSDALLMAAAATDYRPQETATGKIKKGPGALDLALTRTPDVLAAVSERRARTHCPNVVIGFAAETQDLRKNARAKLEAKALDLIVANDVSAPDAGFGSETNRVVLLGREGKPEELRRMSKALVAEEILDRLEALLERA